MLLLYANLLLAISAHRAATHLATSSPRSRALVDAGYWLLDCLVGYTLLTLLSILSFLGIVAWLQVRYKRSKGSSIGCSTGRSTGYWQY